MRVMGVLFGALSVAAGPSSDGCGLRYDARSWLEASASLEAAVVRTHLLGKPKPGDAGRIEAAIADAVRDEKPDGSFGEGAPADRASATNGKLQTLVDLGAGPDRAEVRRILEWIRARPDGEWSIYFGAPLLRLGLTDFPGLVEAVRWVVDHPEEWFAKGCPWTPAMVAETLWYGRDLPGANTRGMLARTIAWIADNMNAAGCLSYWEPWGMVRVSALVDDPLADRLVEKQMPLILRAQEPDGGWGGHSVDVFRILLRNGRLDRLAGLPPLPPDWRVARSIPAPKGALWTLAWGDGLLWSRDGETDTAVAVDPADGREVRRLKLPDGRTEALGWGRGMLLASQSQPKRVLKLDPRTGDILGEIDVSFAPMPGAVDMVASRIWLADGWLFPGWSLDPDESKPSPAGTDPFTLPRLEPCLAAPLALDFAPTGDGVWHREYWAPLLVKSWDKRLLDWGELPFGPATAGIAWDGEHLWALDGAKGRICIIEHAKEDAR